MVSGIYKRIKPHGFKKGQVPWNFGTKGLMKGHWAGKHLTKKTKEKLSKAHKGIPPWNKGKSWTNEIKEKMSIAKLGKKHILTKKGKLSFMEKMKGENNWKWIEDRTQLKKSEKKHLSYQYQVWMLAVKKRDNWKCKINNSDCKGRLESHHILDWINYPNLRYEINNGITLCCAHHPRGRANEKRMVSTFMELLSVSKE